VPTPCHFVSMLGHDESFGQTFFVAFLCSGRVASFLGILPFHSRAGICWPQLSVYREDPNNNNERRSQNRKHVRRRKMPPSIGAPNAPSHRLRWCGLFGFAIKDHRFPVPSRSRHDKTTFIIQFQFPPNALCECHDRARHWVFECLGPGAESAGLDLGREPQ